MEDTTTHTHDGDMRVYSFILFIFGWIVNAFSHLTVDHALELIFHGLSVISVLLVIIINWSKAMDKLFPNRKKRRK
jgi:hypothetical protein